MSAWFIFDPDDHNAANVLKTKTLSQVHASTQTIRP